MNLLLIEIFAFILNVTMVPCYLIAVKHAECFFIGRNIRMTLIASKMLLRQLWYLACHAPRYLPLTICIMTFAALLDPVLQLAVLQYTTLLNRPKLGLRQAQNDRRFLRFTIVQMIRLFKLSGSVFPCHQVVTCSVGSLNTSVVASYGKPFNFRDALHREFDQHSFGDGGKQSVARRKLQMDNMMYLDSEIELNNVLGNDDGSFV